MALTRRTALALSGAVAGTVVAASLAGALVIGAADGGEPTPPDPIALVDATTDTAATDAAPGTTAPDVEVVYQDVYDLPPATVPAGSAGVVGSPPAPTAPVASGDLSSTAVAGSDDDWDEHEDDEWDDEDDGDDHEDDDRYEHEDDDGDEGEWEDD